MKTFKKKELEDFRKQLIRLRGELSKETRKNLQDGMESTRDDLRDIDDFAQYENDVDIWAISNNQKHDILIKIENALERIHNKKYGFCELCSQRIGDARLKAIPYTDLCVDCKEKEEQTTKSEPAFCYPPEEFPEDNSDERENTEEESEEE